MRSRRTIPTYVYNEKGGLVYESKNVIDGVLQFIKHWKSGAVQISVNIGRRENPKSYVSQCELAFYAHLSGINKALKGVGLAPMSTMDIENLFSKAYNNCKVINNTYSLRFAIIDGIISEIE